MSSEFANPLQKREEEYENKFAYDQSLTFKIQSYAYRQLALWAADLMESSDEEAAAYADQIINLYLQRASREEILSHILVDCTAKGMSVDSTALIAEFHHFENAAYRLYQRKMSGRG
jgi:hypothetical protein